MEKQYELYCVADPLFYDAPDRGQQRAPDFDIASRPLPEGWRRIEKGLWLVSQSPAPMPAQGWKVHVSGCLDNADHILEVVWDYCVAEQISFKFLRNRRIMHMRNAKYAARGHSGKLVAIYPRDAGHCEQICDELGARLAGQPGPYILSDLRIGDGPLYVRYGGFADRHCVDGNGDLVGAMEDASGRLVPDPREPSFRPPAWVTPPAFLAPHLAAREAVTVADLPYRIEEALHFSNGGGVYLATDLRSGETVVMKEGRPHAGLAADGSDAVARLERERDMLNRLAGTGVVPAVRDELRLAGHLFLVLEHIDGEPLNRFFALNHPYLDPRPAPEEIAAYIAWAQKMHRGVERAIAAIHERGVVFNDLHIFNVMVRPDESIVLLDLEAATLVDEGRRVTVGNPGFIAPRERTGFAVDHYSLACMRLAMFAPITSLFALERAKAAHYADLIEELFPGLRREYLDEAVREIVGADDLTAPELRLPRMTPSPGGWETARDALTRAILASATPARDDRLFPGDLRQFGAPGGGLGLGYGTAGVLYALWMATGAQFPEYEDWLVERARRPARGARLGLYDGLLGIAHVLERLGRPDDALQVAERFLSDSWEALGTDLHEGLAGAALALGHLADATGQPALNEAAERAADIVAERVARSQADGAGGRAGLLHGASGPALLFIRQFERTGDANYLDRAAVALRQDLDRCVVDRSGALQMDEGWRTLPYLGSGSAGIGCVLDDYLAHREDDRFQEAADQALRASEPLFYAEPGLLRGRAGLILARARRHAPGTAAARDPHVADQVRHLAWHAISYAGGLAFPGANLYRLSMDLGTGTAGVLLGLGAALSPRPVHLPFLEYRPSRRPSTEPEISLTRR